jgi:hypothetical protein
MSDLDDQREKRPGSRDRIDKIKDEMDRDVLRTRLTDLIYGTVSWRDVDVPVAREVADAVIAELGAATVTIMPMTDGNLRDRIAQVLYQRGMARDDVEEGWTWTWEQESEHEQRSWLEDADAVIAALPELRRIEQVRAVCVESLIVRLRAEKPHDDE